jgi:hypothetical protein
MSNVEIIGDFINIDSCSEGEYLQLGFQPSSVPLKQRWRNNGLSADFLGDYVTTFFPMDENNPQTGARQAEIKNAVAYIANELLENSMKYSDEELQQPICLNLLLGQERIVISEKNSVGLEQAAKFRAFIDRLQQSDPMEMFVEQLEANTDDNSGSGLGFLTMINDYGVNLSWRFESHPSAAMVTITTEVNLPI